MGKTLTQEERMKVVSAVVEGRSNRSVAREFGISEATVRNIIKADSDFSQKYAEKKQEAEFDFLEGLKQISPRVLKVIGLSVDSLTEKVINGEATAQQLATVIGILIDKFGGSALQGNAVRPETGVTVSADKLFSLIAPNFLATYQRITTTTEITELVEKGGRGSTKSSFCSISIARMLELHPDCHAVCIRKYQNTLRTSVYAQMQWAIDNMYDPSDWKMTVSPMEITKRSTGQKIMFFGLDDPAKLKSLKLPFGYVGMLWFEELDQFAGAEEIRNVEQSCLRGGEFSFTFKSFNPPQSARNWANRYVLEEKPGQIVQTSDYRSVPASWLGQRFIDDAEHLKNTNPVAYRHEYLGEVTGCGKEVFTNVRTEHIERESFDKIVHGIDWGWYPDPFAFNSVYYDSNRKILYIFEELTRNRTSNEDTCDLVKPLVEHGERLTADSAEPKSCADYTRWGVKCHPAIKGRGSVNEGMKWLQSLEAIVIDPRRCPDTAKEFLEYEYDMDKNGEVMEGYPDHSNHHIDAVRYATEHIWRKPGR